MVVDSLAAILNGLLDYGLIFGHFGLPRLGIEGAAWATVTALWFRVVVYAGLMMLPRYRRPYHLWSGRRLNAPAVAAAVAIRRAQRPATAGRSRRLHVVPLAGGQPGQDAMAATTLAFNVNTLAFVPMFGLGIALSTIVGQQLGRNNAGLAARATWTALWMAMVYMGDDGLGVRAAARRAADGSRRRHAAGGFRPASRHWSWSCSAS